MEVNNMKGKKRRINTSDYKRNKVKRARVKGTEYVTSKGKLIPEKKTGDDCR